MKLKLILIGCASVIMASCATEPATVYRTKTKVYVQDTKDEKNKIISVNRGETEVAPNPYYLR